MCKEIEDIILNIPESKPMIVMKDVNAKVIEKRNYDRAKGIA